MALGDQAEQEFEVADVEHGQRLHSRCSHPLPLRRPEGVDLRREQRAVTRLLRLGLPRYCGGGSFPAVAITIDDGPGPLTPALLASLRAFAAPATFFVIGAQVADQAPLVAAEAQTGSRCGLEGDELGSLLALGVAAG